VGDHLPDHGLLLPERSEDRDGSFRFRGCAYFGVVCWGGGAKPEPQNDQRQVVNPANRQPYDERGDEVDK